MVYSKFAMLILSISAALLPAAAMGSPLHNPIHLHPRAPSDGNAVYVSVYNSSFSFRDLQIAGHVYTVRAHSWVTIKAPVGTTVYAASPGATYHRGDAMFVIAPNLSDQRISLN